MADFDDLPTPGKTQADFGDLPAPPKGAEAKLEKGLARGEAFGRGLVEGTIGSLGTAEEAGRQLFGGKKPAGVSMEQMPEWIQKSPLAGRKTVFPTEKEVSGALTAAGWQEPPKEYGGWRTAGSTLGTFVPVGPSAVKGGVEVAKAGEKLLPGAMGRAEKTLAQVGEAKTADEVGKGMFDFLTTRLKGLSTERAKEAQDLIKVYEKAGAGEKERTVRNAYDYWLKDQLKNNRRNLSNQEVALMEDSIRQIAGDRSVLALEKELRRLKDVADMPKIVEGYDAIKSKQASELAKNLQRMLDRAIPEGKAYRQAYSEASRPMDVFETVLGRKATAAETDPAKIPGLLFQSKHSLQRLKDLTQDDKLVSNFAKDHVATELAGLSPKEAKSWLNKNRSWLEELPDVEQAARGYVDRISKVESTRAGAKKGLYTAAAIGATPLAYYKIRNILGF